MRSEADPELIERARHDPAAFGEVYDHYMPRIYSFCRKYSGNREEAEDLTALTFERALSSIPRYEIREVPFSRWLLRIAANAIIDQSRRKRGGRIGDPSLLPDDDHLEQWEEAYWLRTYVEELPDDQREVVRLRFYEDQPFRDVADRMGRSEGAVKQLLLSGSDHHHPASDPNAQPDPSCSRDPVRRPLAPRGRDLAAGAASGSRLSFGQAILAGRRSSYARDPRTPAPCHRRYCCLGGGR